MRLIGMWKSGWDNDLAGSPENRESEFRIRVVRC